MSTKCTVDHGEGHHLYAEIFEAGKVYLELAGVEFEAGPGRIVVAIPAEIWEKIRAHPIGEFRGFWYFGEDREDVAAADAALAEPGSISLEDLKAEIETRRLNGTDEV